MRNREAYHAGRNRIGEYKLEWFEPREKPKDKEEKSKRKRKTKPETPLTKKLNKIKEKKMSNCTICGLPLEREDKKNDGHILMAKLDSNGEQIWMNSFDSMYKASKASGVSLNTLWNAREKGNEIVIRRKDKALFRV